MSVSDQAVAAAVAEAGWGWDPDVLAAEGLGRITPEECMRPILEAAALHLEPAAAAMDPIEPAIRKWAHRAGLTRSEEQQLLRVIREQLLGADRTAAAS